MRKLITVALFLVMSAGVVSAQDYYLAPTTATPAGSDSNTGTIDSPWLSIDHALNRNLNDGTYARVDGSISGPHTLYMRGGTYDLGGMLVGDPIYGPEIRTNLASDSETVTVKSYPGEWAILDAADWDRAFMIKTQTYNMVFEDFEIKNGQRFGIDANRQENVVPWVINTTFRNLYIHNNNTSTADDIVDAGGNPAGLMLSGDNCIVEYCTFADNGTQTTVQHNAAELTILYNYAYDGVLSPYPRRYNIVRYNSFSGPNTGIKNKGIGSFKDAKTNCGGTNAIIDEHPEWANEIHHNYFHTPDGISVYLTSDYVKIHHNIFDTPSQGVFFGDLDDCATVYKGQIYNNTTKDATSSSIYAYPQTSEYVAGYDFSVYNNLYIDPPSVVVDHFAHYDNTVDWPMTYNYNGYDTGQVSVADYLDQGPQSFSSWQGLGYDADSINVAMLVESDYSLPVGSAAIGAGAAGEDLGAVPYGSASWVLDAGYYGLVSNPSAGRGHGWGYSSGGVIYWAAE